MEKEYIFGGVRCGWLRYAAAIWSARGMPLWLRARLGADLFPPKSEQRCTTGVLQKGSKEECEEAKNAMRTWYERNEA